MQVLFGWLLLFLAAGCAQSQSARPALEPPRAPTPAATCSDCEQQIAAVLNEFHAAAAAADEQRYFDQLTDDAVFLGTDATERWTKAEFLAYAQPHFKKGKAWTFRAVRRSVALAEGNAVAWFEEELATENLGPARGSGVLVLRAGRWRIAQYNLALTIPNKRFFSVKEAATTAHIAAASADDALASLAWLSGAWFVEKPDGERSLEHWTHPSGGTMIGSGHSTKAGKTSFFEYLRIEARDGGIFYVAQPRGERATEFKREGADADAWVFVNDKHDWPKRLTYTRLPAGVHVRVEGGDGQPVEEWTLTPAVIERRVGR